jgi:anti-sigma B factor antagonist
MDLSLIVHRCAPFTTVEVGGEVDRHTGNLLRECALTVMVEHGPRLVVDLAHVTFMDSAGVEVLISLQVRAHQLGGRLLLGEVPAQVLRLFHILGLDTVATHPPLMKYHAVFDTPDDNPDQATVI